MTQAKHTPGPWRYEPYEGSHESAVIGSCYQIATVGYDDWQYSNARLIAAAPTMLAELKKAAAYFSTIAHCSSDDSLRTIARDRFDRLREVILETEAA